MFVGPGMMTCAGPAGCGFGFGPGFGFGARTGAGVFAGGPPKMELIIAPRAGGFS